MKCECDIEKTVNTSDAHETSQTGGNSGQSDGDVRSIERNDSGQLVVNFTNSDAPLVDAHVVRCFPWSVPDYYVSIRDSEGKEAVMLKTLDALDPTSKEILLEELRDKVFNPKILRILNYKHEFGATSITAETDRGTVSFQMRTRDDVQILSPTRALFRDVDGNTYELTDLSALNAASRKHLEQYF